MVIAEDDVTITPNANTRFLKSSARMLGFALEFLHEGREAGLTLDEIIEEFERAVAIVEEFAVEEMPE